MILFITLTLIIIIFLPFLINVNSCLRKSNELTEYRVKSTAITNGRFRYYPQKKFLFWYINFTERIVSYPNSKYLKRYIYFKSEQEALDFIEKNKMQKRF
jgi:phage pi2 protein 07